MRPKLNRDAIRQATVELTALGGRGVLVEGGYIITAAHCLKIPTDASLCLGFNEIQPIRTFDGRSLIAEPVAVELVSDLAVLRAPDDQAFEHEPIAFGDWVCKTRPVQLCSRRRRVFEKFGVNILSKSGEWIDGEAELSWPTAERFSVKSGVSLQPGDSGGPIVNESGELVGIVSTGGLDQFHPFLQMALPSWLRLELFGGP